MSRRSWCPRSMLKLAIRSYRGRVAYRQTSAGMQVHAACPDGLVAAVASQLGATWLYVRRRARVIARSRAGTSTASHSRQSRSGRWICSKPITARIRGDLVRAFCATVSSHVLVDVCARLHARRPRRLGCLIGASTRSSATRSAPVERTTPCWWRTRSRCSSAPRCAITRTPRRAPGVFSSRVVV